MHKFMASLTETAWDAKGKATLYIPMETIGAPEVAAKQKDLVQRLESTLIHWTRQIRRLSIGRMTARWLLAVHAMYRDERLFVAPTCGRKDGRPGLASLLARSCSLRQSLSSPLFLPYRRRSASGRASSSAAAPLP